MRAILQILVILPFHLLLSQTNPIINGHELEHRLVRIGVNLVLTSDLEAALTNITEASAACYNGVILSDTKFGNIDDFGSNYMSNLTTLLDSCQSLGMKVYPLTMNFGYSGPILARNPNLVEGAPVVNAPFVVSEDDGKLVLVADSARSIPIQNGTFEQTPTTPNVIPGWTWQDDPGVVTFWDENVAMEGSASIRISNPGQNQFGHGRINQNIPVEPFRHYHLSAWVRTEDFDPARVDILIRNLADNRRLHQAPLNLASSQDWTKIDISFNTLESTNISIILGVWGGGNGNLWWDGLTITPTSFLNIIRRDGAPLAIRDQAGNSLSEGVDLDSILDPLCGLDPYPGAYTKWHLQPEIEITAGSPLAIGDSVYVDYYHAAIAVKNQVTASLTEPEVFDITADQLSRIREVFIDHEMFSGWLYGHDEIRAGNWDLAPDFGSAGENLAYNFQTVYNQGRALDQDAVIFAWNDMFDPHHNATADGDPYYLVNGYWAGSWAGVPADVVILNWQYNEGLRQQSTNFFADQGNPQIIGGFYDRNEFYTPTWLSESVGTAEIIGVMYTTWTEDFSKLSEYAETVWGGCDFTTSADVQVMADSYEIFPNPTQGFFTISGKLHNYDVRILDALGVSIQELAGNQTIRIDLSDLPAGLYFVEVAHKSNDKLYLQKILKQ